VSDPASGGERERGSEPSPARARDLTRTRIVEAALALLDRNGVEAVTMRNVAGALDVTPMALYNHVGSKADLLRGVAVRALDHADFDAHDPDWRTQVLHCFRELRAICLRHPGLARLLEVADVAPPAVLVPMDTTLAALRQAGLPERDALRTYFLLVSFTLGQADYQNRGPFRALAPRPETTRPVEETTPYNHWDFDAAFEFGLRLVLDGVDTMVK
jgi:AcrR family transcriptional regulator